MRENPEMLLSAMAQYGYSLLQPDEMANPNELLAALAGSDDARVLEGFPVVLANALQRRRESVNLEEAERLLKDKAARLSLRKLAVLSYYLFDLFAVSDLKPERSAGEADATLLGELRRQMERNLPVQVGSKSLDFERVKRTFLRYFVRARATERNEGKARLREELRREYYLSMFFAPKQRDLLEKKMRGEALTKTEREYFSRVVKKKLLALADPDLHRLAQKALQ